MRLATEKRKGEGGRSLREGVWWFSLRHCPVPSRHAAAPYCVLGVLAVEMAHWGWPAPPPTPHRSRLALLPLLRFLERTWRAWTCLGAPAAVCGNNQHGDAIGRNPAGSDDTPEFTACRANRCGGMTWTARAWNGGRLSGNGKTRKERNEGARGAGSHSRQLWVRQGTPSSIHRLAAGKRPLTQRSRRGNFRATPNQVQSAVLLPKFSTTTSSSFQLTTSGRYVYRDHRDEGAIIKTQKQPQWKRMSWPS